MVNTRVKPLIPNCSDNYSDWDGGSFDVGNDKYLEHLDWGLWAAIKAREGVLKQSFRTRSSSIDEHEGQHFSTISISDILYAYILKKYPRG